MKVALLGATGRTGRYLLPRLIDDGHDVAALGRDASRLAAVDARARKRLVDIADVASVREAIADVDAVVSLAPARFVGALIEALPEHCERVIVTGSTRKFTRFPDRISEIVNKAECAFREAGVPGVMLHPSMIFGAPDDGNVNRVLRLMRRWPHVLPVPVPLPGGGRSKVQPIFVDDVVDAYAASLTREEALGDPIIVAGYRPITYRFMVACCAKAVGRRAKVFNVPFRALAALGRVAGFDRTELQRATEDKAFDIADMRERLGVRPRTFEDGLREKLARGWGP